MRIVLAIAAVLLGIAPAMAQTANESDGNADVLNTLMLKAGERCYALSGAERNACCQRYFDNLCDGSAVAATSPPVSSASPPAPRAPSAAAAMPALAPGPAGTSDGPASALNGFVLKEVAQCRPLPSSERRACCERLLHPSACVE